METDILKQAVLIMARRSKSFSQADNRFVSSYTIKQFKVHKSTCSAEEIANEVDRKFSGREYFELVVSDLTYVNGAMSF